MKIASEVYGAHIQMNEKWIENIKNEKLRKLKKGTKDTKKRKMTRWKEKKDAEVSTIDKSFMNIYFNYFFTTHNCV